jgi:hypothetical protein
MATEKQTQAAKRNIKKAQSRWKTLGVSHREHAPYNPRAVDERSRVLLAKEITITWKCARRISSLRSARRMSVNTVTCNGWRANVPAAHGLQPRG